MRVENIPVLNYHFKCAHWMWTTTATTTKKKLVSIVTKYEFDICEHIHKVTYMRRAASRCWTSLFRSRTLKIYCRSWSDIRSKTGCDCNISDALSVWSAVESIEYPVEASIIRWMLDTCVGVGGKRALRPPPPIFLEMWKTKSDNKWAHFIFSKLVRSLQNLITKYNDF